MPSPLSGALPRTPPSTERLSAWPSFRAAAFVWIAVLALHALLLGGLPLGLSWSALGAGAPPESAPITMSLTPDAAPAKPEAPMAPAATLAQSATTTAATPPALAPNAAPPAAPADGPQAAAPIQPESNAQAKLEPSPPSATDERQPVQAGADAAAASTPPAAQAEKVGAGASDSGRPPRFAFPPPIVLNYDVVGRIDKQDNTVSATIQWRHDGANYQASLAVTKFFINLRQWTSKGALGDSGLAPLRFGDKGFRRAELASHFVRDEGRIIFSSTTTPAVLMPGAQDQLSVFIQLASLWAGDPHRWGAGDSVSFQSVSARHAENWTFMVSAEEHITVPGGGMQAIKLTREPTSDYSTRAEIWLAPTLAYLPAHIRLTEPNGNVLDMMWTDSGTP